MPVKKYKLNEDIPRDTLITFSSFMWDHPIYFEEIFGAPITNENIKLAFKQAMKAREDATITKPKKGGWLIQRVTPKLLKERSREDKRNKIKRSFKSKASLLSEEASKTANGS
jgi:hypothetical protein